MPITIKVVNPNPIHGEVYWSQHYVINIGSELRQVATLDENISHSDLVSDLF
jgi:hypothetical protein